jgi:hypothetical protein
MGEESFSFTEKMAAATGHPSDRYLRAIPTDAVPMLDDEFKQRRQKLDEERNPKPHDGVVGSKRKPGIQIPTVDQDFPPRIFESTGTRPPTQPLKPVGKG